MCECYPVIKIFQAIVSYRDLKPSSMIMKLKLQMNDGQKGGGVVIRVPPRLLQAPLYVSRC